MSESESRKQPRLKARQQTRSQLWRWLGWFAMANAVVLGVIGLRYMGSGPVAGTALAWVYLVSIYVSNYSWLALLPLLVLLTPVILVRPSFGLVKALAVFLMAAMISIIVLDSLLWSQSRFHINFLTLKILGSSSWIFAATMFVIGLLFEMLLARRVWSWVGAAPSHRGGLLAAVITVLFVVAQGIFAWADASYYVPVTRVAQQLPVQRGFTAKKLLVKYGLVNISQSRERQLAARMAGGLDQSAVADLNYPLAPLQCSPVKRNGSQALNLLIILVDALRSDMLGSGHTPQMDRFQQQRATWFTHHFSGGNSSRMGVFSLFYGLPPGYFSSFESLQKPPVLMDQLTLNGYQMGLFSSANLYRPVALERTAFARVPKLRIETSTPATSAWERDRIASADWLQWLDQRDQKKPFFAFLFYDAVNVKVYPPEYAGRVPANPKDPMPDIFADYTTAVMFVDDLVGQILTDLERRGLTDNTVVIISSDHGEEFNENGDGVKGHGSGYSRYQLQVPMLLAWPGITPQVIAQRTSHYDVVPTLMRRLLGCTNPATDYSSGHDLYDGPQWDWLIVGSYYNYAVLEPGQVTITFPNGLYEVRDSNYRLVEHPRFNADVLQAVMRENSRFHQQ